MSNLWNWIATCFRLFDKKKQKTDAHNNLKGENNKDFHQRWRQPLLSLQLCGGLMVKKPHHYEAPGATGSSSSSRPRAGRRGHCSHIFHPHMKRPACKDFTEKQLIVTLACFPAVNESPCVQNLIRLEKKKQQYIYIYIWMILMNMVVVWGEALTAGVSSTYLRSGHRGSGLTGVSTHYSPQQHFPPPGKPEVFPVQWVLDLSGFSSQLDVHRTPPTEPAHWRRPDQDQEFWLKILDLHSVFNCYPSLCVSASVSLFSCDPFCYVISCFILASTSCLTSFPIIFLICVSLLSLSVCLITWFS